MKPGYKRDSFLTIATYYSFDEVLKELLEFQERAKIEKFENLYFENTGDSDDRLRLTGERPMTAEELKLYQQNQASASEWQEAREKAEFERLSKKYGK